jgi:hypothetical protein
LFHDAAEHGASAACGVRLPGAKTIDEEQRERDDYHQPLSQWTPEYGEQMIEGWRKAGLDIAADSTTTKGP